MKITYQNLQPFEAMNFRQCIANPDPANLAIDCTGVNTHITGFADSSGAGSTYFPVYAGNDDLLKNPSGTLLKCDVQHPCSIVANSNVTDPATGKRHLYLAQIAFAISPDSCPPLGPSAMGASGSAAETRAMFRWTATTCTPPKSVQLSYVTHNEHNAYEDFSKGLTDFGVTGLGPYPPSDISGGPTYKLAPLSASGVVIAYRAYQYIDGNQGPQITTLTLTPDQIAKVFMGLENNFSAAPDIAALNPGIQFPVRTTSVARAEYNSETYILTSWLKAVAPNSWKPPTSPSPDIFPTTGIDLKFGERAAALEIVDPPSGFDAGVMYIGVMDSSTAAFYGLPTVKIAMPDGSTIGANADSITKAINSSQLQSNGTWVPSWSNTPAGAYPMPMVNYMIAPTNTIDATKGKAVASFLKYAVTDGQNLVSGVDGYVKLPPSLVQASLAIVNEIPGVKPSPIPTPTPRSSPTPSGSGLPPLPSALPSLPGGGTTGPGSGTPCPAVTTTACTGSAAASNSRIAALSYSQGTELAAASTLGPSIPVRYALPSVLGLALLFFGVGLGLRLWAAARMSKQVTTGWFIGAWVVALGAGIATATLLRGAPAGSPPADSMVTGLVAVAAGIVMFVTWIGALIRLEQQRAWGWFTAMLLGYILTAGILGISLMVAYAIAGPEVADEVALPKGRAVERAA